MEGSLRIMRRAINDLSREIDEDSVDCIIRKLQQKRSGTDRYSNRLHLGDIIDGKTHYHLTDRLKDIESRLNQKLLHGKACT